MIRLLASIIFTTLAIVAPVHATCRGQNLYDNTKPDFKTTVERKVATIPFAHGNYWEVSKNGKTSWVIGTIHTQDHRVNKVPAFFRKRIKQARLFQMEMSPDQLTTFFNTLIKTVQTKPRPQLRTDWWSRLSTEEQNILIKEARSKQFPRSTLKKATVFQLGQLIRQPKCAIGQKKFLDLNLMNQAQRAKVPVMGLDDPIKRAHELLQEPKNDEEYFFVFREELKRLNLRRHYVETMVQMYRRGDAIKFLTFESAARKAYVPAKYHRASERFFNDSLLANRNKEWLPRVVAEMNKGNVVTAVGTAHLPGKNGLLYLLQKKGFTIKRLEL